MQKTKSGQMPDTAMKLKDFDLLKPCYTYLLRDHYSKQQIIFFFRVYIEYANIILVSYI